MPSGVDSSALRMRGFVLCGCSLLTHPEGPSTQIGFILGGAFKGSIRALSGL